MHPLRSLSVIALCLMVVVTALPAKPIAAGSTISAINVLVNADLPSSDGSKYPHVVGIGNQVFASGHDGSKANFWKKADTATSWPNPTSVGTASGQSDYASVAITRGPDGSAYVAWIDQTAKKVYMRRVKPDGTLDATKTVAGNEGTFRVYVEIGVATDGRIFVTWSESFRFRYRTSTDGGNTWSGTQQVSSRDSQNSPSIATGPNGFVILGHGGANGSMYAAIWNGSGWDDQTVATGGSGNFQADPTVTVAPNGKAYIAWRKVGGGIYYAERQSNGSWPTSKIADGDAFGTVAIAADQQNNLHMNWVSNISGATDMYYAFKPNNGAWQGPLRTPGGGFIVNAKTSPTCATQIYGHAVAEDFTGGTVRARYFLYDPAAACSGTSGGPSATPLNTYPNGITKDNPFTVGFSNIGGNPDKVRYHWDAAPTNADPLQQFGTSIQVAAPQGVSAAVCETHALYTQTISSTAHLTETQAQKVNVTFDTGVQAYIRASNPFLAGLPTTFSTNDVYTNGNGGAYDGDPNYTRVRQFFLGIYGGADCSGLNNFVVVGGDSGSITNNSYEKRLSLPGSIDPGPKQVGVVVLDKLNNVATPSFALTYDPPNTDTTGTMTNTDGLPVLGPGGAFTADNAASIIRSLSFTGISVNDNLYGKAENLATGKQFWGVWLANSPRNQNPGPNDPNLTWFPVAVPSHNSAFTVQWNLFNGQDVGPRLDQDGTYTVYARFLDGAGNATTQAISATVTLAPGYSIPKLWLPLVTK